MKFLCLILLATSVAGRFTEDFYRLLAKENAQENLIASPLFVEMALTMAYMGAEGNTADELRTALKLPTDKKQVASKYKKLLSDLQGWDEYTILQMANRIYINSEYSLDPKYNEILRDSFQAEAIPIRLINSESAAMIVNQWVSNQTLGKITKIVSPDDMNSDLRAVLLNAISFNGLWKNQFINSIPVHDFKVTETELIPVRMMYQYDEFKASYLYDLDAKVIELPYKNSNLSMLIFLPNKVDGLSQLEDKIIGFSRPLDTRSVHLLLPKFKIEFEKELKDILQKLGIRDAFGPGANFKGIVHDSSMYIEKVLQKAFVEVNEHGGTKAFKTINLKKAMDFVAEHPFAYIIRDENTVYFQGHVVRPQSVSEDPIEYIHNYWSK